MENQKKMDEKKTNCVNFEEPVKEEPKKENKKTKKIVAAVAGIAAAAFAGYCGYKMGEKKGWKDGYNTGSSVTTIIERTPERDLESVGQEIGVNAKGHKECSDRIWERWTNRPRKTSW